MFSSICENEGFTSIEPVEQETVNGGISDIVIAAIIGGVAGTGLGIGFGIQSAQKKKNK